MGYYSSNKQLEQAIELKCPNEVFNTIEELYNALETQGWCKYSAYNENMWNPQNKCNGQCNATVLLVQEYFGGDIVKYPNPSCDKNMHYFNRIGECDIDLTSAQFNTTLNYEQQNKTMKASSIGFDKECYILKLRIGLEKI